MDGMGPLEAVANDDRAPIDRYFFLAGACVATTLSLNFA